ncbi:MAG: hypothetical protein R2834_04255 [Rhodothermales bacterium]
MAVQALAIDPLVLQAGLAPGLLAVAILLVNNVRDVEEDRSAAKRTLVVRLEAPFRGSDCTACASSRPRWSRSGWRWRPGHWPVLLCSAVALAGLPMVGRLGRGRAPAILNPMLGATARLLLLYSIVFAVDGMYDALPCPIAERGRATPESARARRRRGDACRIGPWIG